MLTKPRRTSKLLETSMYSRRKHRRFSPLLLVGLCVPVLLALIAGGVFILPRLGTHAAAANVNCTLIVPPNPLTAQGLATPYQLVGTNVAADGPCNEANITQSAFVQADILDPATGQISAYEPLVIDQGTQPAVAPVVPTLPANAVVGIWFGFNATNLTLQNNARAGGHGGRGTRVNAHLAMRGGANGHCVNGLPGSPFGQFAYCNAVNFFQAANNAIAAGQLKVPALGTANDGQVCPSTESFAIVDMDQSDNVQTQYLANGNGQIAQFSAANQAAIANATTLANPSDNALLSRFVDPALGCTAWQVPGLVDNNNPVATFGTDALQAMADQQAPVALVPGGDEMTLVNGQQSLRKTNLYRAGADETPAASLTGTAATDANTTTYCQNIVNTGLPRLQLDMNTFLQKPSPDGGATANSLFTFLANRMNATLGAGGLNCVGLLNIQNPIALTTDGNGVVTAATINPTPAPANANNGNGNGNGNGQTPTPANTNNGNGQATTPTTGNGGNGQATTPTTGNGGNGQTPTPAASSTAQGTATFNLDPNAGNVNMALNITYPNHPNQAVKVNVRAGSCTGPLISTQRENLDGQSANNTNTVINNVQGQALPNNWFFTVADPQQTGPDGQPLTVGCGSVVANGTTGTATLGMAAQQ
jgi:hypothetical protein